MKSKSEIEMAKKQDNEDKLNNQTLKVIVDHNDENK